MNLQVLCKTDYIQRVFLHRLVIKPDIDICDRLSPKHLSSSINKSSKFTAGLL